MARGRNASSPCRGASPACPISRGAFTLIELLVVIGIIAILMAIFTPFIAGIRTRSKLLQCSSNLRQIGLGVKSYLVDHDNVFPPVSDFQRFGQISEFYMPYLGDSYDVFKCMSQKNDLRAINPSIPFPSRPNEWPTYEYNSFFCYPAGGGYVRTLTRRDVTDPTICAYAYDYPYFTVGVLDYRPHAGGMNVLYLDWHVSFLAEEDYGTGTNTFYERGRLH